jgi:hypothetical protein
VSVESLVCPESVESRARVEYQVQQVPSVQRAPVVSLVSLVVRA